jgi:hypothetical protein
VLAVALPLAAGVITKVDTVTAHPHNWEVLAEQEDAVRSAATIQMLGLLAAVVLIGVVAPRIGAAYPTFGPSASAILLLAGAGFVLLRSAAPIGFAALTTLDISESRYSTHTRVLEGLVTIAGPASLTFAATAVIAIAVAALVDGRKEGIAHGVVGIVLLMLGSLSMALDRDPGGELFVDQTWTRPGGPLTVAGLVVLGLWAIWLAGRPSAPSGDRLDP